MKSQTADCGQTRLDIHRRHKAPHTSSVDGGILKIHRYMAEHQVHRVFSLFDRKDVTEDYAYSSLQGSSYNIYEDDASGAVLRGARMWYRARSVFSSLHVQRQFDNFDTMNADAVQGKEECVFQMRPDTSLLH